MTELKGTNVASGLVPFTDQDKYPTHYSQYGKGGYRTVQTLEERDTIPEERREEGMLCYVIDDPSGVHTYKLSNTGTWKKLVMESSGIPIYDKEELDRLGEDVVGKHIFIPSESDLSGEIENNTYTTESNGSYLDILFQSIRQLQVEVSKMRNAFRYGISSYTDTDTAMSGVISDEAVLPEDEPLWAIEPDMLSMIVGADVAINSDVSNLLPLDNIVISPGRLTINNSVDWIDDGDLVKSTEDSKIFIYLTTSNLNILINLISQDEEKVLNIDLGKIKNIVSLYKYNLLVVISRKIKDKGGKNFVWISIGNPNTNITIKEGYYNPQLEDLTTSITELDKNYTVDSIKLTDLDLYQLDFYSKYQEFTKDILPSKPNDQDYKYRVAHLTIRSVKNKEMLESIKEQLPNNELIFEEATKKLWIKNNDNLIAILGSTGSTGGGEGNDGTDNNDMTADQLIEELKKLGIIYETNEGGNSDLRISSISDITFIHQATGKQFKFEVNSEGSLVSSEVPEITLEERIDALSETSYKINETEQFRGFVAKLHCSEAKTDPVKTGDVKLNSDRIKIGAVYMPHFGDTAFGCSHAFIELENTSDKDFPLNGCYLHFLHPDTNNNSTVEHLALEGILPAGSTFLIRGKKYSDPETNPNTFISVDDYDMEWYINGELLDLTVRFNSEGKSYPYGFALTYGQPDLTHTSTLRLNNQDTKTASKAPNIHPWYYIDSLPINSHTDPTNKPWGSNVAETKSNSIIKNTFELDPAKQAFQALTTYDSSRTRLQNIGNDIQVLDLNKPVISFPHSTEEYPISRFTPRSSRYNKNVSTDKTKFNLEKPNAVTCAFGIDVFKTRCFNWVSAGEFDEFLWIKDNDTWKKFESYKAITSKITESEVYPRRKEFEVDTNNTIYSRLIGNFPGCNIHYTAHKCIIDVVESYVSSPTTYTYVVGRADTKNPNIPDQDHVSEEYTFTLYPETYKPRVFLTTDQQGFHWIEYQVWSAAANFLSNKITTTIENEGNIFPVLLNTGDMTQNGTRVNEWLDYFNGGHSLLNHLEHMAVVGNNDLCGPNPEILGTGDDNGKSNSYYFHVFFCYEVDESIKPIVNGKYIPSLYYFDTVGYRFLMANSEITYATCKTWYGLDASTESNDRVFNIYTGHGVVGSAEDSWSSFNESFTSIYTMMWTILSGCGEKKPIVACHEMPFTVITTECIHKDTKKISRSVSGTSLVGCHMNQLTPNDNKAMYWFSRLCEFFKVKLVLGGHKHTYAVTNPVREYYYYDFDNSTGTYLKNSLSDGPMEMPETLKDDDSYWLSEDGSLHLSKFPLLHNYEEVGKPNNEDDYFWPYTNDSGNSYLDNFVTYFMCQATGYKQTSNKELPTNFQSFSKIIPKSNITISGGKVTSSKADDQQKYPMYLEIRLEDSEWNIALSRVCNILNSKYKFTQSAYSTDEMKEQFAIQLNNSKFCSWVNLDDAISVDFPNTSEIIGGKSGKVYKLSGGDYWYCVSEYSTVDTKYTISDIKVTSGTKEYTITDNKFTIDGIEYTIEEGNVTSESRDYPIAEDNTFIITTENPAVYLEIISEILLNITI